MVGEYHDERASAYSGDRGPGLASALAECEQRSDATLIVQHSDRLARGDGRRARHLVEYALWAIKAGVKIMSVQDPQTFNDLYAVVTGQRNHEDSARKGAAVAAGLRRTARRGEWGGGPVPDGYAAQARVEREPRTRR